MQLLLFAVLFTGSIVANAVVRVASVSTCEGLYKSAPGCYSFFVVVTKMINGREWYVTSGIALEGNGCKDIEEGNIVSGTNCAAVTINSETFVTDTYGAICLGALFNDSNDVYQEYLAAKKSALSPGFGQSACGSPGRAASVTGGNYFIAYPNPAKAEGRVNVIMDMDRLATLSSVLLDLIDINGKLISRTDVSGKIQEVVSLPAAGSYQLILRDGATILQTLRVVR
ncbi:T9SS type A sorting domain-containing protein [Chitinophagaceae bacterium MMS25-I14]